VTKFVFLALLGLVGCQQRLPVITAEEEALQKEIHEETLAWNKELDTSCGLLNKRLAEHDSDIPMYHMFYQIEEKQLSTYRKCAFATAKRFRKENAKIFPRVLSNVK